LIDHIYRQARKGAVLLAASEVMAEGCGVGLSNLPRDARNWVARHPTLPYHGLQPMALKALNLKTAVIPPVRALEVGSAR
jgi:hypothetical protein